MTTPAGNENEYYNTDFMSTSFGTEQELSGVTIKMPQAGLPNIVAVVLYEGVALVVITKDVEQENAPNTHTIELRTTPAELDDGSYSASVSVLPLVAGMGSGGWPRHAVAGC
jgi:hypothetical protein